MRKALKPLVKSEECLHTMAQIDEILNYMYCPDCKQNMPYEEIICESDVEVNTYKQEYNPAIAFGKKLKNLYYNNRLPDWRPLFIAFLRFNEAYKRCIFKNKKGVRLGKDRNLFGRSYTLYRLAKLIRETLPEYQAWMDVIKPYLPLQNQLRQLDDHWLLLNAKMQSDWQSIFPEYQSLFGLGFQK